MKKYAILGGLAASLFALPALAQETAYTTEQTIIEAGPAPDYPEVGSFGPGTPVTLYGCVDGWTWCDVSYGDVRGWIDGERLAFPYQGRRVPVETYGSVLAVPIISFSFGDYWDHHYHDRPFYRERDRFEHHAPPPHREPARGEPRPEEHGPRPDEHAPHPGPVAHPGEPHPGPVAHPGEPHPAPVARPGEPHPPEARPPAQPQGPRPQPPAARPPGQHPEEHHEGRGPEEHHEGDQPHQ